MPRNDDAERRRAPSLDEVSAPMDEGLRANLERALSAKLRGAEVAGPLRVEGKTGAKAACVVAMLGTERRAHELFVFTRAPTGDEALDRCIDYLDGIIDELAGATDERFLPLDWEGRPYAHEHAIVFVRGEVRDYVAEEQAAALLGEPVPPRGLR